MINKKLIKTILINERYLIYTDDFTIYDIKKSKDIPAYIYCIADLLINGENPKKKRTN